MAGTWTVGDSLRACLFCAVAGTFAGLFSNMLDANARVWELKNEAVKLGHAKWEVTERVSEGRMGRKEFVRTYEFKWNKVGSSNCLSILQEEAVAKGYANWFNLDDGSRGFEWVEPKGEN